MKFMCVANITAVEFWELEGFDTQVFFKFISVSFWSGSDYLGLFSFSILAYLINANLKRVYLVTCQVIKYLNIIISWLSILYIFVLTVDTWYWYFVFKPIWLSIMNIYSYCFFLTKGFILIITFHVISNQLSCSQLINSSLLIIKYTDVASTTIP